MPTIAKNRSKVDRAWLAGILDGEGCVSLYLHKKIGFHLVRVMITNTNEGILLEVKRILDSLKIHYTQNQTNKKSFILRGYKPCFVIEVNRQLEAKFLLEQLLPYMKETNKVASAHEVLEYIKTHQRTDGKKPNLIKRSDA